MSSLQRLSRTAKVSLLVAGMGFLAACGIWYVNAMRPPKVLALSELSKKQDRAEFPDPVHLNTLLTPPAVRDHLLDGDFKIVFRMEDISESCTAAFDSSFVNASGTVPKAGELRFADPGQAFQASDVITTDVPFRRLSFAGLGPKTCFVYYQRGGTMYPSYCLAVMDHTNGRMIWVGEARKQANGIEELRSILLRSQFEDANGPVC
jgi:hypothetical protein